jgi:methylenetetrahydrofolate reductase (NADPH)
MRIAELFKRNEPVFSFEFFPPKTEEGVEKLYDTIGLLAELEPAFVSITYGAGGTTRRLTMELATRIKEQTGLEVMAHLTCVNQSRDELEATIGHMVDHGIENVLALRGDPPKGSTEFVAVEGGFSNANHLIEFIREKFDVCIGAACYPEGHVENPSKEDDLNRLKSKVDAGAEFLVSQLFFESSLYSEFAARARAVGISVPIIPGLMPVTNVHQVQKFSATIGAAIPERLLQRLERYKSDDQAITALGIEWSLEQARDLLKNGAPGVHFYTLNRSLSTRVVCRALQTGL